MVMQVGVVEVSWEKWWGFSLCWVFLVCLFIVLFVSGCFGLFFFVNQCMKHALTKHKFRKIYILLSELFIF